MIFNMRYWQAELRRTAVRLRRHGNQQRWVASSDPSVEKAVMLGFYAVRKMLEGFNPPPVLEKPPVLHVITFPRNCSRVPSSDLFWPSVTEAFNLAVPSSETLDLKSACNQIIHSHYFSLWLARDRSLRGVFVCSDRMKEEKIYRFDLDELINLFDTIAGSSRKVVPLRFAPETNRVTM